MNTEHLLRLMILQQLRGGGPPGFRRGGTQGRGGNGVEVQSPGIAERFRNRGGAGGPGIDFNREQQAIQLAQQNQAATRQHELEKIALSGGIDRATQADRLIAADHNLRNELKFRGMDADADRRLRMAMLLGDHGFRGEQAGLDRQHDMAMLGQQAGYNQQRDELGFYQQKEQENGQWMATMAQQKGFFNPEAAARFDNTRRQLAKVEEMRQQLSPVEYYQARSQVFDEAKRYDWQNNMDNPVKKLGVFDYFVRPDGKGGSEYMKLGVSDKATPQELQQWAQNQFIQIPGVGWMTLSPDGGNSTFYPESKLGQQTPFDYESMYQTGVKILTRSVRDPETQYVTEMLPTHEEVMEWMNEARLAQQRLSKNEPLWSDADYSRVSMSRLRNVYRDQYGPAKAEWDNNRATYRKQFGVDMGEYWAPAPESITPDQLRQWAPQLGFPDFKRNPVRTPSQGTGDADLGAPAEGDIESHTLGRMSVQGQEANRMAPPTRQQPAPLPAVPGGRRFGGQVPLMPNVQLPPEMQTMRREDAPTLPQRFQRPAGKSITMPDVQGAAMQRESASQTLGNVPRLSAQETSKLPVMTLEQAEAAGVEAFVTPDGIVYRLSP